MMLRSKARKRREKLVAELREDFDTVKYFREGEYLPVMDRRTFRWNVSPTNRKIVDLEYVRRNVPVDLAIADPVLELIVKHWERGNVVRFAYRGSTRPIEAIENFATFLRTHKLPFVKSVSYRYRMESGEHTQAVLADVYKSLHECIAAAAENRSGCNLHAIVSNTLSPNADESIPVAIQTALYKDYERVVRQRYPNMATEKILRNARDRPVTRVAPMSMTLNEDFVAAFDRRHLRDALIFYGHNFRR